MIKNKDKRIYDPNQKFFPDFEVIVKEAEVLNPPLDPSDPKRKKPFYIKDAIRTEILDQLEDQKDNDIPTFIDPDDEDVKEKEFRARLEKVKVNSSSTLLSHEDELKQLKQQIASKFKKEAEKSKEEENDEDDDDDDFLVVKKKTNDDLQNDSDLQSKFESQIRAKVLFPPSSPLLLFYLFIKSFLLNYLLFIIIIIIYFQFIDNNNNNYL